MPQIVKFQICPGCRDVLTKLTFVSQSKVNIFHVNLQIFSDSYFILTLITLVHDSVVDLLSVSLDDFWIISVNDGATVVLVPLKLHLRESREGTLVTEIFLAVTVVFALLLEESVFLSLVLVEGCVPGCPVVTLVTLQPSLLVPRPAVRVEVGQVVGPVVTVGAGEDVLTRVNLFVVS